MKRLLIIIFALLTLTVSGRAERSFVHPGCSYTKGQLDRMKAMVEAKIEPYYTTYLNLLSSEYTSLTRNVADRGTQIKEGSFNGTVGIDGRCAHDLALLWHITGDDRYADKAIAYLNANNHYTNTSARGTGPLDNGKINLLIEAAELMRDYEGWKLEDQQKFKDMLVYPYYSNTEDVAAKYANWSDDSKNGITFYWNIMNGDAGRYGNQGLFGMLAMLAMGVYLDNEIIYERALNYISGLPHRSDDLPYPSGPPNTSKNPTETTQYQKTYTLNGRYNDIEDYGYDEVLKYYFYPNGQCQESSRDQGHVLAGLHKYIEIAEIAWNQGDDIYSLEDHRLLKGIEFNLRYNLSKYQSYPDQPDPWEPAGYTDNWDEVSLENNMYLQTRSRSGRWESIKPYDQDRGGITNVGSRTSAYAHYLIREGRSEEETKWLQRTQEYTMDKYGVDTWGTAPNWYYEWNGWGTLTKSLEPWMAGDPVTFVNGERVSGLHVMPGSVNAADYDYYNAVTDGEGHTYHKLTAAKVSAYRPDGGAALKESDGKWVVYDTKDGEWLNYTVSCPIRDRYNVYVTYKSSIPVCFGAAVAGGEKETANVEAVSDFNEALIGSLYFPAGASVVRLYIENSGDDLEIASIRVAYNSDLPAEMDFTGEFNAQTKRFTVDWKATGMLATNINLWRSPIGEENKGEIISSDNTMNHFVDENLDGKVSGYSYWLSYLNNGEEFTTETISFEWGELNDTFENEEISEWNIPGANGTGSYADGVFSIVPNSKGEIRISRSWSFPFHAGNFPILAFCMKRPEGLTMALYSGANSWQNDYDVFTGKEGDNVYYYDFSKGSFQNNKGESKTIVVTDDITNLPLQLRTIGPANSEPLEMHWVRTFRSIEEMKEILNEEENSDIGEIYKENKEDNVIYNLIGLPCGKDVSKLPHGIYIIDGKKIII